MEDLRRTLPRLRADIGMVFQRFNLSPHLTAIKNIIEGSTERSENFQEQAEQEATKLLARQVVRGNVTSIPTSYRAASSRELRSPGRWP